MSDTASERKIYIEQHKKFSESCLWRFQREYFDKAGIDAWVNQVPFYITSNPFIAKAYAKTVMAFVQDWVKQHPDAKKHPFYIMELGTGSGRFSYYVLKNLDRLKKEMELEDISICYVMSDFTKHNIQYYEKHHALLPYIEKGMVDFGIFDMETERPILLSKKNIRLGPDVLVNPLIVFANYIFDTVSHDSFSVHEKKLYELLVSVSTPETNMKNNQPADMEKLTVDHSVKEAKSHYYNNPAIDAILDLYKTSLKESSFLIPIGSLRAIDYLRKLSNDHLLLISTDKGYTTLDSLENLGHPSITFHGSFSMMVNFHAIGEYFKNIGGYTMLQTPRKSIKTSLFATGIPIDSMPTLLAAIEENIEGFSPGDYFTLHCRVRDFFETYDIDTLAAHLQLTDWDPHIYLRLSQYIVKKIPEADTETIQFLSKNLPKIASNYYFMPKTECILFEIAVFYHAIKDHANALTYYIAAEPFIGEQFGLLYNIALCLHQTGNNEEALKRFKEAKRLTPDSKEADEWITYLENLDTTNASK